MRNLGAVESPNFSKVMDLNRLLKPSVHISKVMIALAFKLLNVPTPFKQWISWLLGKENKD